MDKLGNIKEKLNNYKFKTELNNVIGFCFGKIIYADKSNKNQEFEFNNVEYNGDKKQYIFIKYNFNGTQLTNIIEDKIEVDEINLIDFVEFPIIGGKKR